MRILSIITITFTGLLFLAIPVMMAAFQYGTVDTMTCTVDSKERVNNGEYSRYMVFCDEEVLENTDTFWHWKFNSADVYRDIKEGEQYELKVYGWRVPFLSMNRNIIDIQ